MIINVPKFISNPMCTLPDDAEILQNKLYENILAEEVSQLDFSGATDIISRFINIALGQLLERVSENDFDKFVKINYEELDPDDATIIRRALENAKEYYRNRDVLEPVEKELFEDGEDDQ